VENEDVSVRRAGPPGLDGEEQMPQLARGPGGEPPDKIVFGGGEDPLPKGGPAGRPPEALEGQTGKGEEPVHRAPFHFSRDRLPQTEGSEPWVENPVTADPRLVGDPNGLVKAGRPGLQRKVHSCGQGAGQHGPGHETREHLEQEELEGVERPQGEHTEQEIPSPPRNSRKTNLGSGRKVRSSTSPGPGANGGLYAAAWDLAGGPALGIRTDTGVRPAP